MRGDKVAKNKEKKIDNNLVQKKAELEKKLQDKIQQKLESDDLNLEDLQDLLKDINDLNNIGKTKLDYIKDALTSFFSVLVVHIITSFLLLMLFINEIILDNKILILPIIGGLSFSLTLFESFFYFVRKESLIKQLIFLVFYLIIAILCLYKFNSIINVFNESYMWIIFMFSETILTLFVSSAINRGKLMFRRNKDE